MQGQVPWLVLGLSAPPNAELWRGVHSAAALSANAAIVASERN